MNSQIPTNSNATPEHSLPITDSSNNMPCSAGNSGRTTDRASESAEAREGRLVRERAQKRVRRASESAEAREW